MGFEWLVIGLLFLLVVFGVVLVTRRGQGMAAPRDLRRKARRTFLIVGVLLGYPLASAIVKGDYFIAACWAVVIGSLAYEAIKKQTERDAQRNYALIPGRCGRCEYDLTGNVSGVCPECGWKIPEAPMRVDSPYWYCWWKGWRIGYLENWRRSLATMFGPTVFFVALAVWWAFYWDEEWIFVWVIGAVACSFHFAINTARVVQYARRHRDGV